MFQVLKEGVVGVCPADYVGLGRVCTRVHWGSKIISNWEFCFVVVCKVKMVFPVPTLIENDGNVVPIVVSVGMVLHRAQSRAT